MKRISYHCPYIIMVVILILATDCKKENEDPPETVTDTDGNVYTTVTIGTQVWMAENLRTTTYNDGTSIPQVTANNEWKNMKTAAFCWYGNDADSYGNTYGALYNWYAVNTDKLCPAGWHVPTHDEWTTLTDYIGGAVVAGGKLKESGTLHWDSPNFGATNETGFTGLPGGSRQDGGFMFIGVSGSWWSATESNADWAIERGLNYNSGSVFWVSFNPKSNGYSVRCLKD
ncbi:MAG: fibrobacter succinogenes major paralogous domain-containing protein [Bacteroidales bacterium]|nr:fibrobacter succinogenes major paralogous domain-containing protein [Bacteroidales bacterium]